MNVELFFRKAFEHNIITSNEVSRTKELLKAADLLWEKELRDNPKIRSIMSGEIVNPDRISEGRILEIDHLGNEKSRPIIDLVQQGGGMFGIALLGYTYILEKVGIRFHSYGGTSAGAINAALLAAVPNSIYQEASILDEIGRGATKSEVLTHIIANTDFNSFMDRGGILGYLQELLFKNFKSWKLWLPIFLVMTTFLVGIYLSFSLIFNQSNGVNITEARVYDFVIGTCNVFAFTLFCYFLLIYALGSKFGINSGRAYYNWVDVLVHLFEIGNTKELKQRLMESSININANGTIEKTIPRLVLIAANLTHNKIVKLPEEAGAYWKNPWNINPSAYLRATMSLPFIYEVLVPDMRHYDIIESTNNVSTKAKFVDGGMLSNFPIREFHRTDGKLPSFPTFGVLLSSREPNTKEEKENAFLKYLGSYLKTFRNFYDNDFLMKNSELKMLVELVNTTEYNWLNFWMSDAEKRGLFEQGAIAAIKQLEKFDWTTYLSERNKEEGLTQFR
ncbi:MAG: patatin-like phospholipase family protein [Maribacter litoralis]|uniref:patatin-like phospholipase family protein n=1 Tax=Maribacter litoralis TaxID=2059726 RepID=UPI0032980EF5